MKYTGRGVYHKVLKYNNSVWWNLRPGDQVGFWGIVHEQDIVQDLQQCDMQGADHTRTQWAKVSNTGEICYH